MTGRIFSKQLAGVVASIAVLSTASALSFPIPERAPGRGIALLWFGLLALHAALYWWTDGIRDRVGLRGYAAAQGAVLFAIALVSLLPPVVLGLFVAFTAAMIVAAGRTWGAARITAGTIALFVLASLLTSDMYRAATAGMVLALTGLVAHAIGGLLRDRVIVIAAEPEAVEATPGSENRSAQSLDRASTAGLSSRELEVLRELAGGARNSDIAAALGISERTVKAHLGNIYQKLGVTSRAGAIAVAAQRKLLV